MPGRKQGQRAGRPLVPRRGGNRPVQPRLRILADHAFGRSAQELLRPLEPGNPGERELSGGQTQVYTGASNASQISRIIDEQKGIEL